MSESLTIHERFHNECATDGYDDLSGLSRERVLLAAAAKFTAASISNKLEDVDPGFDLVINCAGIGAKSLRRRPGLEPHRGQVAIVPKIDLAHAVVCDDSPLMYAIPRANDCVFGGTNDVSDDRTVDPDAPLKSSRMLPRARDSTRRKCSRARVGLRPFRKSGVRVERAALRDGRAVIHNYGHGGSGFTLSWGCADEVYYCTRRNRGWEVSSDVRRTETRYVSAIAWNELTTSSGPFSVKKHS